MMIRYKKYIPAVWCMIQLFLGAGMAAGQGIADTAKQINALFQQRVAAATAKPDTTRYGADVITDLDEYRRQVAADSLQAFAALDEFIPGIVLDIRYATDRNFMGEPMYRTAAAYLRLPAARALKSVQEDLRAMGYGLKIFDGYRPYSVTVDFYEKIGDSTFVASPWTGSRHNRGCAVDLTLIDLRTGEELPMPTGYDSFTDEAHTDFTDLSPEVIENRELLKQVMTRHGFDIYPDEWWHYDFSAWENYPLMDIPFEEL